MFAAIETVIALYTVLSFVRFVWSDVSAQSPDSALNGQYCDLACEARILDGSSCEIACEVPEFTFLGDWYLNKKGTRYSRKSDLTRAYQKAVAAIA